MSQGSALSANELVEFLAEIGASTDERSALRAGVERAAGTLEAQLGAVLTPRNVVASIGWPSGRAPHELLLELVESPRQEVTIDALGRAHVTVAELDPQLGVWLVFLRLGDEPFDAEDQSLLSAMARALSLELRSLRTLESERAVRRRLQERQHLLEKLNRIQRSISHRAPLQDTLDAITEGCSDLLGGAVVGLRLIDTEDPNNLVLVSAGGPQAHLLDSIKTRTTDEGASGRAVREDRLVLLEGYPSTPGAVSSDGDTLWVAMSAPVHEEGIVAGALSVASSERRTFTPHEQDMLVALADNASLAIGDVRAIEAKQEAERSRDMFLTMVSHELKTPLTVILGNVRTLAEHRELPDDLRDGLLHSALQRGDDLTRLVDMLLEGTAAELSGSTELFFLPDLVRAGMSGFENLRPLVVEPVPRVACIADARAVRQIMGIFLENAVSHSPLATDITVRTRAERGRVSIGITNRGRLPADFDRRVLFEPFRRGPEAESPGVGLGLYIASRLTESLGGAIDVVETAGSVTFSLEFPVGDAPAEDREEPS